jgi:hypothetical protein
MTSIGEVPTKLKAASKTSEKVFPDRVGKSVCMDKVDLSKYGGLGLVTWLVIQGVSQHDPIWVRDESCIKVSDVGAGTKREAVLRMVSLQSVPSNEWFDGGTTEVDCT